MLSDEQGAAFGELGDPQNAGSSAICAPFEYASFGRTPLETRDLRMLESVVELLGGLLLSALPLLIGSCIVGSIVAALRAVSRGS